MTYLKLVPNEFRNASHDKRELSVAKELGYEILVIATTKENRNFREYYDGYDVYRISTRRFGQAGLLRIFNRIIAFLNYILKAIQTDADIISGHDYVATLAGYIANCFRRKKAKLVYDSHEFELQTFAPTHNALLRIIIKIVEGFLLRHVDLTLVVGDKIADGLQEIYNLDTRPTVVRNIAPFWHLEPEKSAGIREMFLQELGFSDGMLLMYHGGIGRNRGIEDAVRALFFLPSNTGLIIIGKEEDPGLIKSLKEIAEEKGVYGRILYKELVPVEKLKYYIGAVDIEIVLQNAPYLGMAYSLPNKFFESIQACVPIICCDLPEMGAIIRQYDIGLLVKENDAKGVADAVLKLREDKELYSRLQRNMDKAKEELCWEKESLKLKAAIQGLRK